METAKNKTVIRGQITYHDDPAKSRRGETVPTDFPEIRVHGTVKPIVFLSVPECGTAVDKCSGTFHPMPRRRSRAFRRPMFEGTYRSQDSDT